MLFAEKAGTSGIWRIDQGTPRRVADGLTPASNDFVTISGDRLYYADMTDSEHPAISVQSVYGGNKQRLLDLPLGMASFTLTVNPKTGDIIFSQGAADDTDIALVRLERK
jgi:hypothetical protein